MQAIYGGDRSGEGTPRVLPKHEPTVSWLHKSAFGEVIGDYKEKIEHKGQAVPGCS